MAPVIRIGSFFPDLSDPVRGPGNNQAGAILTPSGRRSGPNHKDNEVCR